LKFEIAKVEINSIFEIAKYEIKEENSKNETKNSDSFKQKLLILKERLEK